VTEARAWPIVGNRHNNHNNYVTKTTPLAYPHSESFATRPLPEANRCLDQCYHLDIVLQRRRAREWADRHVPRFFGGKSGHPQMAEHVRTGPTPSRFRSAGLGEGIRIKLGNDRKLGGIACGSYRDTLLHGFEHILVLPSRNAPLGPRALRFEWRARTCGRLISAQRLAVLLVSHKQGVAIIRVSEADERASGDNCSDGGEIWSSSACQGRAAGQ
jgi:hypothetical protein